MRRLLVLAIGVMILAGVALATQSAWQPPPVILDLGELAPTPAPSPQRADRIRLITSFTVQNKPEGDSIISFEATDLAQTELKDYRIIASEVYSLSELKKGDAVVTRDRILAKLRDLERDLLVYVEQVGPPRGREPVTQQGVPQRPAR